MTSSNSAEREISAPGGVEHGVLAANAWAPYQSDSNLRTPPGPGTSGRVPPGEGLDLHIGWDRFEKLMLAVSRRALGLRGVRFRRYGVQGQKQHGIDLAGRRPDGVYTVVQCKDYKTFTARHLRNAVEKFTSGKRPFGAPRLIVATSATTEDTQLADELASLQEAHRDLELDLWGTEQINEHLRYCGDIVAQFWTRETAADFCTGAPLPGVPAPPPERQEQAERILVGPLNTDDVTPLLRSADSNRGAAPAEAASVYGELADRLHEAGYRGHATVLRKRQLEALQEAGLLGDAASLAADLAVAALYQADSDHASVLSHVLDELLRAASGVGTGQMPTVTRHAVLINAAVQAMAHPLTAGDLCKVLEADASEAPEYQPTLVLLLAERVLATEPEALKELDSIINSALAQIGEQPATAQSQDTTLRLRLVRAEYDSAERRELLNAARRHRVKGQHAALISAREGRRCALEGRADEASENWRDAVYAGIHAGLAEDAADWLYSVRSVNLQYGPLTTEIDDEHRLAQALRTTGSDRLLDRTADPRSQALAAMVGKRPTEAVQAARRWLTDSVVTGSWAAENEAVSLLGDLYRDHQEPNAAAICYQRTGVAEKLTKLAEDMGDELLPLVSPINQPWWVLRARAALAAAQADLIDDAEAQSLFADLLDLSARGRSGELIDSPTQSLTLQAVKSACAFATRTTPVQAAALLDLLSPDVPREPHHYARTDKAHARACADIAATHPQHTMRALTRLFDLADGNVDEALKVLVDDYTLHLLGARASVEGRSASSTSGSPLSAEEQKALRVRADQLAERGHYLANVIQAALSPAHPGVLERAAAARDRILERPDPDPFRTDIGSRMVSDSYMVRGLELADQKACLKKLLAVAKDRRETALSRQDALTGIRYLIVEQAPAAKAAMFLESRAFVSGELDGSHLDEFTGQSHPLSSFKINLGSASLRSHGLWLAASSASTSEQQNWVRDQAAELLHSPDKLVVHEAAAVLNSLPRETTADIDPRHWATHAHLTVRLLSAVLSMRQPQRFNATAVLLATDRDVRVRRTVAEAAAQAGTDSCKEVGDIVDLLTRDRRHSVRAAARPRQ
ncbi:hypothetical protein [Streptomyces sp. NPDC048410]|uniref:hypothetical protein n=1 Tax=Streptomyces sp. NPDC048410 TaxID=3365545 RepID=UPI0037204D9A